MASNFPSAPDDIERMTRYLAEVQGLTGVSLEQGVRRWHPEMLQLERRRQEGEDMCGLPRCVAAYPIELIRQAFDEVVVDETTWGGVSCEDALFNRGWGQPLPNHVCSKVLSMTTGMFAGRHGYPEGGASREWAGIDFWSWPRHPERSRRRSASRSTRIAS